jgi:hypothetical protein
MVAFFAADAQPGICVAGEPAKHTCVGCPADAAVDDALLEVARWGTAEANRQIGGAFSYELVRVRSASKQVVAGIKYTLALEVVLSTCANDGVEHAPGACGVQQGAHPQILTVQVVDAPWRTPRYTLLSHTLDVDTPHP